MPRQNANISELEKSQDGLLPQNVKEQARDLITQFEELDDSQMLGLTADYLEFKINTTYNMVFVGFTTMNTQGKEVKAAELIDKNNKKFINASTVLTNSLIKVTKMPCLVRIVTKDFVKSDAGKYLDMDVLVIPPTVSR